MNLQAQVLVSIETTFSHLILCDISGMNVFEFKFEESYRATNKFVSIK